MNAEEQYPALQYQALVHNLISDKSLDYHALTNAINTATFPGTEYLAKRRLSSKAASNSDLLSNAAGGSGNSAGSFVVVTPSDYTGKPYAVSDGDEVEKMSFHDNDVKMEYADRHPFTTMESDVEDGVDPDERYPYYRINEGTAPITTTSAEHLYGIAFAGPGGIVTELKAAYILQLSARIDESRKCLALDGFEYKPRCFDAKATTGEGNVPTYREIKRWEDCVMRMPKSRSMWEDDEGSDADDDDPSYDDKVRPREGRETLDEKARAVLMYQATAGAFLSSRCLRVWLPLSNVVGVRLQAAPKPTSDGDDDDVGAVLILEVKCPPPKENGFAARKVLAKYRKENEFAPVDDWTPNKVASRATRYYLYGNLTELRQTAALMAKLCPHIANMLASKTSTANALRDATSVVYAAAPDFAKPDVNAEDANSADASGSASETKKKKLSAADVHKLLIERKIVKTESEANNVNPCLKRAILLGHIKLDDSTTKDTVIYRGRCVHCSDSLSCALEDALYQSTYGGHDYCDGGEDAGVKCASCVDDDECGGGNYITGLCRGEPDFDSGKFHNHCTECADFGTCLRDYREAHCKHCGGHYFAGNSGFPCPSCGGGKSKPLKNMAPPPLSAWDGKPENATEVFEAQCARLGAMEGAMMKAMVLGPEAALSGDNAPDSSQLFSSMITQIAGQIEGDAGGERAPEECRQM